MSPIPTAAAALALALALAAAPAEAAFRFFNPALRDSIPALISGTGFYADMATKVITPEAVYFDVNTPLWTDGASKSRYVVVPSGTTIAYGDTADAFVYPDGAMVIKNFALDTITGDPRSRILVETRFTAFKRYGTIERWYLFSYKWRRDQSDAELVPEAGVGVNISLQDAPGAAPRLKKWIYPGVSHCAQCHRNGTTKPGRMVLAFFTAQINRPLAANPAKNQVDHYFDIGLLKGVRPDLSKSPRWARMEDETASLELRSRAYLASNCSGCHGQSGVVSGATPNVTMDLDYHDLRVRTDLVTKKIYGAFPLDSAGLIVPGRPEKSLILYRQESRNAAPDDFVAGKFAMPPLGSYEPDTTAVRVITRWVRSLGGTPVMRAHGAPSDGIRVVAGRILLPASLRSGTLSLRDHLGRNVPLIPSGDGAYKPATPMAPGLHILLRDGKVVGRLVL